MYVRNYGIPRGTVRREGEPSLTRAAAGEAETPQESIDTKESPAEPIAAPQAQNEAESTNAPSRSEADQKAVFGTNGIPPQPLLKRRVLKRRRGEVLPQIAESTETEHVEAEQVDATPSCGSPSECPESHPQAPAEGAQGKPKCERPLSFNTEDLFLGGLLLLLMGDRADDDVLITLAFLLFSGFKLR